MLRILATVAVTGELWERSSWGRTEPTWEDVNLVARPALSVSEPHRKVVKRLAADWTTPIQHRGGAAMMVAPAGAGEGVKTWVSVAFSALIELNDGANFRQFNRLRAFGRKRCGGTKTPCFRPHCCQAAITGFRSFG